MTAAPHLAKARNLVMRTFFAFVPSLVKPDDAFAAAHLSEAEYILYARMDKRDRDHACQVAKATLHHVPVASTYLVRAALLHDVGKAAGPFNPWERIAVHLYTPKAMPEKPRLRGLRGAWQRRVHHEAYGAELIRRAGGHPCVVEIVERHHHPQGHPEAERLKQVEELF